jgi:hypothetical protein
MTSLTLLLKTAYEDRFAPCIQKVLVSIRSYFKNQVDDCSYVSPVEKHCVSNIVIFLLKYEIN